jgi:hypothetical protein
MRSIILVTFSAMLVASCGAGGSPSTSKPSAYGVAVSWDKNRKSFSGTAGSAWTEEDLRSDKNGGICGADHSLRDLNVSRQENGTLAFTGRCV